MLTSPSILAENLFNVEDVVAVVTGGGTGIGLMAAQALEANGAKAVYIVGRRMDVLENAAKTAEHGKIIPVQGNVTSRADMQGLISRLETEQGRLDILIHCAGAMLTHHPGFKVPEDGSVEKLQETLLAETEKDWSAQFAVNTTAVYFLTAACLGLLKSGSEFWKNQQTTSGKNVARTSQVITAVGISAYSRFMGSCMGYVASKAAVLQLMKTMATVLAPTEIRFNSLAPGIFPTEITAGKGRLDDQNRNFLGPVDRSQVPQGRAGNAQDIAGAILYLCGKGGFYVNGSTVVVDGGRLSLFPASY
ncbi:NAD(P)-binding protein [Podospora fimiseda]|uniref:NAD(P)-binding protein n=1 Tax=Podospora fimiseda TaxID=252190 RepID=A0AAN7BLU3_9PEZI|nr:NAD(P)-binding protein [Podospora fimiseda]